MFASLAALVLVTSVTVIDGGDLEAQRQVDHDKKVRIVTVVSSHVFDMVTTEVGLALTDTHEAGVFRTTQSRLIGKAVIGMATIWALNRIAKVNPGLARKMTKMYAVLYGCIGINNIVQARIAGGRKR